MPRSFVSRRSRSLSRSSRNLSRKRSRTAPSRASSRSDDSNMSALVMVPRGASNGKIYKFSRWVDGSSVYSTNDGTITGSTVTLGSGDIIYQAFAYLSLLPQYAEFTALFSEYRITELEYHFINCMYTDVNAVSNSVNGSNSIRNCAVYIGGQNNVLGTNTIQQMQQEEGVIVRDYVNCGKPFIIKIKKPTFNQPAVNSSGGLNNFAVEKSGGWLDTTSADVPYRGVYLGLQDCWNALGQPGIITANRAFTVRIKMTLEFKGVR